MQEYKLSAVLEGHKLDVRCITTLHNTSRMKTALVSGSRDHTARLWSESDAVKWKLETVFEGHPRYVSSIAYREPDEKFDQGLIYTGCLDGKIRAYEPTNSNPRHELEGHSGAVSSIFITANHTLLTGSWDKTARVWLHEKNVSLLKGHEGAVWCVVILPDVDIIVTGSADYSIKLWKEGQCKNTITGVHSQAVRSLGVLSSTRLVSCSNDGLIILWSIMEDEGKEIKASVARKFEDSDYVYSLCVFPNSIHNGGWVSSGENTGVKVFHKDGTLGQTIDIPVQSVWCVTVLPNGDIAAGSSDHRVYIFSNDPTRIGNEDALRLYKNQIEQFRKKQYVDKRSSTQTEFPEEIGGVKVADMPIGPDALLIPGRRNGQTKMVKWLKENKITAHTWSEEEMKWNLIGDVISNSNVTARRATYNGKEYDYVFDIDVGDGIPPLKLPYNNIQDPYHVAQDFIHQNELPQTYLDEIAKFIHKNSSHQVSTNNTRKVSDPFTGNGAYVAGSTTEASNFSGKYSDPFTGKTTYSSQPMDIVDPKTLIPKKTYLPFEQIPNMEALERKVKQLNASVPKDAQLTDTEMEKLVSLFKNDNVVYSDVQILFKALRWPQTTENSQFNPTLDIVRLALLNHAKHGLASEILQDNRNSQELLEIMVAFTRESQQPTNQMLAMKGFSNIFTCNNGIERMYQIKEQILEHAGNLISSDNKNCQIAVATLILNYAVASTTFVVHPEIQKQCLTFSSLLIVGLSDAEAKYRVLIAIGTLIESSNSNLTYAKEVEIKQSINSAILTVEEGHKIYEIANLIQARL